MSPEKGAFLQRNVHLPIINFQFSDGKTGASLRSAGNSRFWSSQISKSSMKHEWNIRICCYGYWWLSKRIKCNKNLINIRQLDFESLKNREFLNQLTSRGFLGQMPWVFKGNHVYPWKPQETLIFVSSKRQRKQQSRHEPCFHIVKSHNLRNFKQLQKKHKLARLCESTPRDRWKQWNCGSGGYRQVSFYPQNLSQLNKIARSDAKNIGKYHLIFSLGRTLSKYRITMVISETPNDHPRKRDIYPKKRLTAHVENPGIDLRPWSSCFS